MYFQSTAFCRLGTWTHWQQYTHWTNYSKHPLKDIAGSTIEEKEWYFQRNNKQSLPFNVLYALQKKYKSLKTKFAKPDKDYLLFEKWDETHFKWAEQNFKPDDYRILCEVFLIRLYHYIPLTDVHYNYHSKGSEIPVM